MHVVEDMFVSNLAESCMFVSNHACLCWIEHFLCRTRHLYVERPLQWLIYCTFSHEKIEKWRAGEKEDVTKELRCDLRMEKTGTRGFQCCLIQRQNSIQAIVCFIERVAVEKGGKTGVQGLKESKGPICGNVEAYCSKLRVVTMENMSPLMTLAVVIIITTISVATSDDKFGTNDLLNHTLRTWLCCAQIFYGCINSYWLIHAIYLSNFSWVLLHWQVPVKKSPRGKSVIGPQPITSTLCIIHGIYRIAALLAYASIFDSNIISINRTDTTSYITLF